MSLRDIPTGAVAVTPDNGNDLTRNGVASPHAYGLSVAASGNVKVTTLDGDTPTIYMAAGVQFALRVRRVWSTGTTATGITAYFGKY